MRYTPPQGDKRLPKVVYNRHRLVMGEIMRVLTGAQVEGAELLIGAGSVQQQKATKAFVDRKNMRVRSSH